jgi:hypothetical protein
LDNEIYLNSLAINFPNNFAYNIEYSKAFSIIFVLNLGIGKEQYEIGKNTIYYNI